MDTDTKLASLEGDVASIRMWCQTHDKAHVTDDDRLNIILETVTSHNTNHHGTRSRIKESGLTVIFLGCIAILGEVAGLWELFSSLPRPF